MFAARGQEVPPPVWLNQYDGLPCPDCGRVMDTRVARRVAGDVTVNSCHLHGTWLDRDGRTALLTGDDQAERMRQILRER
jgi:hypothetical protein